MLGVMLVMLGVLPVMLGVLLVTLGVFGCFGLEKRQLNYLPLVMLGVMLVILGVLLGVPVNLKKVKLLHSHFFKLAPGCYKLRQGSQAQSHSLKLIPSGG